jgi:hypothetical protein
LIRAAPQYPIKQSARHLDAVQKFRECCNFDTTTRDPATKLAINRLTPEINIGGLDCRSSWPEHHRLTALSPLGLGLKDQVGMGKAAERIEKLIDRPPLPVAVVD